ncbi:MAG: oligosaccharide flippase family protein [Flavobacteriaceae bacterium]|uniref:oligosaccharide flippase family protein n=1 Tax=Flagellimonas sp. TaxID=2058762 RepID=UPI003BAD1ED1|nr:oligosaccharide flippase family protein [Flavobacteriaceae bacterium]
MWTRFSRSEFTKNVSSQIVGTGMAQALPLLATPILTRVFSEKDFATYTSFFAFATIFAVGVGAKYPMALVLPKEDSEAGKLFTLSIYITVLYSLSIAVFFLVFNNQLPQSLGLVSHFVPLYVLFFGIWTSFSNLSIRFKKFKDNAVAKVIQSLGYIVAALLLGLTKFTLYGLVLAKIIGTFISWLFLYKKSSVKMGLIEPAKLKGVAMEYIDYPKYGVVPAFLNTISSQALVLAITKFYSIEDLGQFGLTYIVLSAPLALIGTSYKDVFYQRMAFLINAEDFNAALKLFKKSAGALFFLGLPICAILYFMGEDIFGFIFGEKWIRAGEFAAILAFSFMIKLVVSPLSSIFNAANKLKISSIWQTLYFVTTFLTLGICTFLFKCPINTLLYIYVIHELIIYTVYFLLQYRTLRKFGR